MDSHLLNDDNNAEFAMDNVDTNPGFYSSHVKHLQLASNAHTSSQPPLIYALTSNLLVGLPLYNCSQYKSCASCLNAEDPFCGWCTLESR